VGTRAGLEMSLEEKSSCLCRDSNLDRPVVQSVATHYTNRATGSRLYKISLNVFVEGVLCDVRSFLLVTQTKNSSSQA
jgi:hypothetical protein